MFLVIRSFSVYCASNTLKIDKTVTQVYYYFIECIKQLFAKIQMNYLIYAIIEHCLLQDLFPPRVLSAL